VKPKSGPSCKSDRPMFSQLKASGCRATPKNMPRNQDGLPMVVPRGVHRAGTLTLAMAHLFDMLSEDT